MKLAGHLLDYASRPEDTRTVVDKFRELIEIIREERVHGAEVVQELEMLMAQVQEDSEHVKPPSLYPARALR